MIDTGVQDRNSKLEEYLQLLHLLGFELNRAMQAISGNSLTELEDSIANQQAFSTRLSELAHDLSRVVKQRAHAAAPPLENGLVPQIRAASEALENLNRRYSALLQHSSHSVALLVSLFRSFQGQIQEGSGPRLKQQTWSCRI